MDSTLILSSLLEQQQQQDTKFPTQFIWPKHELSYASQVVQLSDPPVDISGFLSGNHNSTQLAASQIRTACLKYGFFQVVNHGVDSALVHSVQHHMDAFFNLPLPRKLSARRKPGNLSGYSGAHSDRFASKLPWKETFSFTHDFSDKDETIISHINSVLGNDFQDAGFVFVRYCEAMRKLSLAIFELMAISMGVEPRRFREFFEDGSSIIRGNNYPPCKEAELTLGTGPHCDPNSLTILHQDEVGGLEIFYDGKWRSISPCPGAFVINIGDTFMALTNGEYKSCLHRAVVNKEISRRSLVFFVNPKDDKVVRPCSSTSTRHYPDFTWSEFKSFTQNNYRADGTTLQNFVNWLSLVRDVKY